MTNIDETRLLAETVRALGNFMGPEFGDTELDGYDFNDAAHGVLIVEGIHQGRAFQATFQGTIDWID